MCFGNKKEYEGEDEGSRRNKEIEKVLQEDKKRVAREVKILLLGKSRLCWTQSIATANRESLQVPVKAERAQS